MPRQGNAGATRPQNSNGQQKQRQSQQQQQQNQHQQKTPKIICKCCGATGHVKKECRRRDEKCLECGMTGHLRKVCRLANTPTTQNPAAKQWPAPGAAQTPGQNTVPAGAAGAALWICASMSCQDTFQSGKICGGCKKPKPKTDSQPSQPAKQLGMRPKDEKLFAAWADKGNQAVPSVSGAADGAGMDMTADQTRQEAAAGHSQSSGQNSSQQPALDPAETAAKTKYLAGQENMLKIAKEGGFPAEEISTIEAKIEKLKKELSRKGLQTHVEISQARVYHEDRYMTEKAKANDKFRKAGEDVTATKKRREEDIKKQEEENKQKMAIIATSFDKFDVEAAERQTESQKAVGILEQQHKENMDKFQVLDEQITAAGGNQPEYIPSKFANMPVITPNQVDRSVIQGSLTQAVQAGQICLTNDQGAWIAKFVEQLLNVSAVTASQAFSACPADQTQRPPAPILKPPLVADLSLTTPVGKTKRETDPNETGTGELEAKQHKEGEDPKI